MKLAHYVSLTLSTAALLACTSQTDTTPAQTPPATEATTEAPSSASDSASKPAPYPQRPLWGDTHLHTDYSLDAKGAGVTLSPADAYRFARGDEVTSTTGLKAKLSRPLDFLVVSDHSDGLGAMKEIMVGNERLLKDPTIKDWYDRITANDEGSFAAVIEVVMSFTTGKIPEILVDPNFTQTIWDDFVATSDRYNDPGKFTAMIGYEWTSNPNGGNNLHRNILYRDGADFAKQMLPFTVQMSPDPRDLWKWMGRYEAATGGQVLAIAHNGNVSNGTMFPVETLSVTGAPVDGDYVTARKRWEPLYEVTQIKGDGEAHPFLSTEDEFADYENWDTANLLLTSPKTNNMLQYEYAREALKNGLKLKAKLGTNPYKFGMIGSTDSHTGLATADENNFFGKHAQTEPNAARLTTPVIINGDEMFKGDTQVSSGYAAVWAAENTRDAIFDAMMRKEVYATTGPRMTVRFFGGWDYTQDDMSAPDMAAIGYAKGVPMGGDLPELSDSSASGTAPTFLIAAMKDAESGHLDRVQIVKGWLDADGQTQEKVYNVAWSDPQNRMIDTQGKLPAVGNTVDVSTATWRNDIGEAQLSTVWTDPDFDPAEPAFYYGRVIEIPTPRWADYDAVRFNLNPDADVKLTTQERAYTSPIWYQP